MNKPTGLEAQSALPAEVSLFCGISQGYKLPSWIFVKAFPAVGPAKAGSEVLIL